MNSKGSHPVSRKATQQILSTLLLHEHIHVLCSKPIIFAEKATPWGVTVPKKAQPCSSFAGTRRASYRARVAAGRAGSPGAAGVPDPSGDLRTDLDLQEASRVGRKSAMWVVWGGKPWGEGRAKQLYIYIFL